MTPRQRLSAVIASPLKWLGVIPVLLSVGAVVNRQQERAFGVKLDTAVYYRREEMHHAERRYDSAQVDSKVDKLAGLILRVDSTANETRAAVRRIERMHR